MEEFHELPDWGNTESELFNDENYLVNSYSNIKNHLKLSKRDNIKEVKPLKVGTTDDLMHMQFEVGDMDQSTRSSQMNTGARSTGDYSFNNSKYESKYRDASRSSQVSSSNVPLHTSYLFPCREFLLRMNSSVQLFAEYLQAVTKHIENECDINKKVIDSSRVFIFRNLDNDLGSMSRDLPKEALVFYRSQKLLYDCIMKYVEGSVECFESKKLVYADYLKKSRENCNLCIRQAIQAEREEAGKSYSKLKNKYDSLRSNEIMDLQKDLKEANDLISELKNERDDAREVLQERNSMRDNYSVECNNAVSVALKKQTEQLENEKKIQIDNILSEQQRIREELLLQTENVTKTLQNQVEYQRTLNEEKKSIMAAERAQLQNEISTLHEQLMDSENKLSLLHESSASRLKEEQRKHQQAIQLIQSENIKEQSRLKNDMQNIIQKLENDEMARIQNIDVAVNKDRELQLIGFNLQLERREEKYKHDLKRLLAFNDTRFEEEISRLKHFHEQEINRLLRENDRLQKQLSRVTRNNQVHCEQHSNSNQVNYKSKNLDYKHSGQNEDTINVDMRENSSKFTIGIDDDGSKFVPVNSTNKTDLFKSNYETKNSHSSKKMHSLHRFEEEVLKNHSRNEAIDSSRVSSNPSVDFDNITTYSQLTSQAKHANLHNTLNAQDSYLKSANFSNNEFSEGILGLRNLPDSLPLDEAYEAARQNTLNSSSNINLNARNVSNYMGLLHEYLDSEL